MMSVLDLAVFAVISGLLLDTINSQRYEEASLGDVMIDKEGFVNIYYTDGTRNASWDRICGDYGSPSAIGRVICRQLGYQDVLTASTVNLRNEKAFGSDSAFHAFDCGDNPTYSHILQCSFTAHIPVCHNKFLSVTCNKQVPLSDNLFDGHVRLCPPRGFPVGNQSFSTGLILISLHNEWRGINQQNSRYPLGSREADSICRQLGYTDAVVNSAKPWNATSEDYSSCYGGSNVAPAAWFTTDDPGLHCGSSSQDCIGCCFQYPPSASNHCTNCTNTTDVVITCTYDLTILRGKGVTGWSARNTTCSFSGKSLPHSACAQQDIPLRTNASEIPLRTFEIVVGSVGSVAVLLLAILTIIIIVAAVLWCCPWLARRCRGNRQLVERDEN